MTANNEPAPEQKQFEKKFIKHFQQYPIVNSSKEAVFSLPYSQQIYAFVGPYYSTIRDTQPVKVIFDKGDSVGDIALSTIDEKIPKLKTLEVHDLTDPVTRPVNGAIEDIKQKKAQLHENVEKKILVPSIKVVADVRGKVHSILYDANGKDVITSKADPLVGPVNDRLVKFVEVHFPQAEKVPKEGQPSEASRTIKIVYNVIAKSKSEATT